MRAAARAAQSGRTSAGADRGQEFPPEPDDYFPPEPDDPFPPDPQDTYQPRPQTQRPEGTSTSGTAPGSTAPAAAASSGGGRWSDALHDDGQPAISAAAPERPSAAPTSNGEAPVVDDEGRDSLPPEEPRTFGQNALRRALAEGRVVRSRPAQNPAGGGATTGSPTGAPTEAFSAAPSGAASSDADWTAGSVSDQGGESSGEGRPALQAVPPTASGSAGSAPSADAAPTHGAHDSAAGDGSAAARAAASWGTAATTSAPTTSTPAASAPAATAPAAAERSPAAPRSGAALVREAALASRNAGQRFGNRRGAAEEPAADVDPTGGATRDDEDAVVATRNGREVVEKILGGKVLEIIDETKNY